jgi:hypothetical protein
LPGASLSGLGSKGVVRYLSGRLNAHTALPMPASIKAMAPAKNSSAGQTVVNGVAPLPPLAGSATGMAGAAVGTGGAGVAITGATMGEGGAGVAITGATMGEGGATVGRTVGVAGGVGVGVAGGGGGVGVGVGVGVTCRVLVNVQMMLSSRLRSTVTESLPVSPLVQLTEAV